MVRPIIKCKECGELKQHKGHGLCARCHHRGIARKRYALGIRSKTFKVCLACNEYKGHRAHGLCDNCYAAIRQRKKYTESEEVRRKKSEYGKVNRERKNELMREYYLNNRKKTRIRSLHARFRNLKEFCEECFTHDNLELHHITYEEEPMIQILCKKCHGKKHRRVIICQRQKN